MSTQKELGTTAFKAKDFATAAEHFGKAIEEDPRDHALFSNRSACYHNLKQHEEALGDAEMCINLKSDWGKGHQRKAMALHGMGHLDEAYKAYQEGLKVDPDNSQIKSGMQAVMKDQQADAMRGGGFQSQPGGGMPGGFGGGGMPGGAGGMFGPDSQIKLMANPKTAAYFKDPQFAMKWEMCQQNPQQMMQLMQMDGRIMECIQVLTGVDIQGESEKAQKKAELDKEAKKKKDEEDKKKKEEAERLAKEEAEKALPPEERAKLETKKKAEAEKAQGNDYYKKKDFENALKYYQNAIDLCPDDIVFHSNKAAVYFEMKKYEDCVACCDEAVKTTEGNPYDYVKLAKALARKGNALLQMKQYDESIAVYQKAMLENNDHGIKMQLQKAQKTKKDAEALAFINPEKAEEHRVKGNELFKEGKFPQAIKEYEEGLKRDPQAVAIYSNRCATYIKLTEFSYALKDAEKCLQINPQFVKAYARKGTCHHMMKEYHKALKSFEDGLKIEPQNKDCLEGKQKTMMTIQSSAGAGGANDEERLRHAMADPEIQQIMQDPMIQQVLQNLSTNPQSAMGALKDPHIADKINKLVAAGVVKMG